MPRVHVAITGIEKVVEKLAHVPPILSLLTRSATGQAITTYVNMISSPRKADELDGPDEVHVILLDNGIADGVHQMRLPKAHIAVQEKRVVVRPRFLGHGLA